VAGLPDLSFEEQKKTIPISDFCEQLEGHLHPADYEQIKLILLIYDNKNLISFLKHGETEYLFTGNYNAEIFMDQVERLSSIIPVIDLLPGYMVELTRTHYNNESSADPGNYEQILAEGYYHQVMKTGTPFLKKVTEFDYNMKNLLTTLQTGKHNLFQKEVIVGENSEFEFFNEIQAYAGSHSFTEAERKYDMLRWKMIEEALFFEYFSHDWLLGYLLKLLIIRRWSSLNHDSGEQKLRQMIADI